MHGCEEAIGGWLRETVGLTSGISRMAEPGEAVVAIGEFAADVAIVEAFAHRRNDVAVAHAADGFDTVEDRFIERRADRFERLGWRRECPSGDRHDVDTHGVRDAADHRLGHFDRH